MPLLLMPLRSLLRAGSESISRMPCQPFWALVLIISTKAQACKLLVGGVKFNCHTHVHARTHRGTHTTYICTLAVAFCMLKLVRQIQFSNQLHEIVFPLSPSLPLSLSLLLAVVVLYFNFCSSWHWHNSPQFAGVCVCGCLCGAWLPSEPLSRRRRRPSTSPFTPWTELPYGNRWQLGSFGFGSSAATSQNAPTMGFSYWNPDQCERHFQFNFNCDFGHFAGCEGKRQQLE